MATERPDGKIAIIEQLSWLAREDQRLQPASRGSWMASTDEQNREMLETSLAFLSELRLQTLEMLRQEALRTDSLLTEDPLAGRLQADRHVAAFLIRFCSPRKPAPYRPAPTVAMIESFLIDLIYYRDILASHGGPMFTSVLARVKKVFGLTAADSLAEAGAAKFGIGKVLAVLDVAACIFALQFEKTSAHINSRMGYAGLDAYADAKDDCHFMTPRFARFIMDDSPTAEQLADLMKTDGLAQYDVSPTNIDHARFAAELSKLYEGYREQARNEPPAASPPDLPDECSAENGKSCYLVEGIQAPATFVTDTAEYHLTRRQLDQKLQRRKILLAKIVPAATVTLFLLMSVPVMTGLVAEPSIRGWLGVACLMFFEAALGVLLGNGIGTMMNTAATGFFRTSRELNQYTVLQGRRSRDFLAGLRTLRPELFRHSNVAGLPRLFTLFMDREGLLLLGKGREPRVVAGFHWRHLTGSSGDVPGHSVILTVRQEGQEVPLTFRLERAKAVWTTRSYAFEHPLSAVLASIDGARLLRRMEAGEPGEPKNQGNQEELAQDYERTPRPPLRLPSIIETRRLLWQQGKVLAGTVLACALGPLVLQLLVG
ncbi:hypothetical protein [Arthrobacter rhizosphaerae]|uniref:hypothetical protein n=1 Tax=Arthrobacter rhizosphaerae TaxID=2855490 RepID=UPI001FF27E6C|nr:hypothetical protein [Arthrobacter rhizosphaerae]